MIGILALGLSGCGGETADADEDMLGMESQIENGERFGSPIATRADFEARGLDWPLTVDSGRLGCTKLARWIEVEGMKYGLNGIATEGRGYREIEAIWRIDERTADQFIEAGVEPLKINIGDMSEQASLFC